jgi:ketopantoate hydroxymethyltransferase
MVFAIRNLSVLAYANGFTLWHYKAGKERLEAVTAANFFADGADMLAVGDLIMVSAADGARIICVTMADIETVTSAPLA